ncbi:MAG: glycosyltransferase family 2 protein [Verrucomicrobiota bacterium]
MSESSIQLSVVTPAYKCAACIEELYRRIVKILQPLELNFEIIFVDDCSPDNDWEIISQICQSDERVRGIKLSRNFGQHQAISAGLDHSQGEWTVVMDCDLQDRPEAIPELLAKADEGYDVVLARRVQRSGSLYRKISSRFFILLYNYLGDVSVDKDTANFSIASRTVIKSVCRYREQNRSYPLILNEVGFKKGVIDVEHAPRHAGKSAYNFFKLFDFSIQCIVAISNKPLRLSIRFGFLLSLVSIIYGIYVFCDYFINSAILEGWTTLVLLTTFLGGLGFANLGILGLYLGKVFDEVKQRPLYVVQKIENE